MQGFGGWGDCREIQRVVFLSQVLYVVLWCAVFSTIHMYLDVSTAQFWVLCVCVSLVSVILTAAINLIFHYSNKDGGLT